MKINLFRVIAVFFILLSFVLTPAFVWASTVQVSIEDGAGGAFPNVLVILKSLEDAHEVFRVLTDSNGHIPVVALQPGLYRIIATCPYGLCETKLQEVFIGENPLNLVLRLAVVSAINRVIVGPNSHIVQVLDKDGNPVSNALVIARDVMLTYEKWYKTDNDGKAKVILIGDPAILVIVSGSNVIERIVDNKATLMPPPAEKATRKKQKDRDLPKVVIRIP
jgi:hypothetical protein